MELVNVTFFLAATDQQKSIVTLQHLFEELKYLQLGADGAECAADPLSSQETVLKRQWEGAILELLCNHS